MQSFVSWLVPHLYVPHNFYVQPHATWPEPHQVYHVTCTVTPRPVVPPNLAAYDVPPTHFLRFSPFHQPPCTKSVGEHWQLPRLYRGSRRELLGVRLLPHGHHEHRRLRRRRLHDPPRPHRHRLLPPLRAGKWGGRSGILASPIPLSQISTNEKFILTKRNPCPPQPNGQTHYETFCHICLN